MTNDNKPTTLMIDDVQYTRSDKVNENAKELDGMPYVIARTYSAGVFAGYLESRKGEEGIIRKARRIWYWEGAASLSQLSQEGVSKPENCKFPIEIDKVELTGIIEIDYCTEKARLSIKNVPVWSA